MVLIWIFALLQNSQTANLASFRPPPTRHCLPNSWNVREIPRIIACQIGPFASARGAPEALTRWPCATQPGLPPLRAQFQSGILIEWSFALVLGLGYRGGPRGFWGQLVQSRPGYASGAIIIPIDPFNDVGRVQVAVRGWSPPIPETRRRGFFISSSPLPR